MRYLWFDLIWGAIIAVLVCIVMYPIYQNVGEIYPFYFSNIIFIIITGICVRLFFFLEYSIIRKALWVKVALIFLVPLSVFPLLDEYFKFHDFLDNEGIQSILGHLSNDKQLSMAKYIKSETIFFGVSAFISAIAIIFRMIVSIWRQKNTNKI